MSEAIFGLIGVVVGGVLTGLVTGWHPTWSESWAAYRRPLAATASDDEFALRGADEQLR